MLFSTPGQEPPSDKKKHPRQGQGHSIQDERDNLSRQVQDVVSSLFVPKASISQVPSQRQRKSIRQLFKLRTKTQA